MVEAYSLPAHRERHNKRLFYPYFFAWRAAMCANAQRVTLQSRKIACGITQLGAWAAN